MSSMKEIMDFANRFDARISLDTCSIVTKQGRYFLVSERLKPLIRKDFFYAGAYLGKVKNRIFFPSFILLSMIAKGKANKIVVDDKSAWLFIVGRDIFKRGIVKVTGLKRRGYYTLILNRHNECLGFGRILRNLDEAVDRNEVVVRNIADIGDFLRREKQTSRV